MKSTIIILAILFLVPEFFVGLFTLFLSPYTRSKKDRRENELLDRTRYPFYARLFSVFILIWTICLFAYAFVVFSFFEKQAPDGAWIALILSSVLFIVLALTLVLIYFGTYEIIREDGIIIVRPFRKNRFVAYSDMGLYENVHSERELTVFDCEHKEILSVYDYRVGIKSIVRQLDAHGVPKEEKEEKTGV